MRIHADLTRPAAESVDLLPWTPSPTSGVERRMLDRDGEEVARATTVVRYAPGSRFPTHVHGAGEEFLVLEGIFADENGVYPAGTYVRNPPGTAHAPFTEAGCTILVKLRQMPAGDAQVVVDADATVLHDDPERGVRVTRESWDGPVTLDDSSHELYLLEGGIELSGTAWTAPAWIRLPRGAAAVLVATGARVWHKAGHLPG